MQQAFHYVHLKYSADTLKGEWANIGIFIWAPSGREIVSRVSNNFDRLKNFWGDQFDLNKYQTLREQVLDDVESFTISKNSPLRILQKVFSDSESPFQISAPKGVLGETIDQALDMVFSRVIR